jgi:HlyD family secretion protein
MKRIFQFMAVLIGAALLPWESMAPSGASSLAMLRSPSAMPLAYRTAPVERGDLVTTVQAAGTLKALVTVDVGSQISGLVKELFVDFNSRVTEGQVIARVEPQMYEARLAQAQAELEMAQSSVSIQRAQIERVRAELENVEAKQTAGKAETLRAEVALHGVSQEVERKRSLARQNFITTGEWERLENAYKSAQAQTSASRAEGLAHAAAVRSAQAAFNVAEAQLANTLAQVKQKEAVLRQAQIDLERTYIRAPVTGTVVNRAVSGGQTLAATLQSPVLFTIAQDLTKMQVEASVVEADVSRFELSQPVIFTVDAYPGRSFAGAVKQIRKAPQIVQNVVTYTVVISADNFDELLLPGMTANLQVIVAQRTAVRKVPNSALRFRPSGETKQDPQGGLSATPARALSGIGTAPELPDRIYVLDAQGEPSPVSLRLGITDGRMTEVLAGPLQEGQQIITGLETAPGSAHDAGSVLVKFRLR